MDGWMVTWMDAWMDRWMSMGTVRGDTVANTLCLLLVADALSKDFGWSEALVVFPFTS